MGRIIVSAEDTITVSENNLVTLTLSDGKSFEHLEPRRLFPVSRADVYISLLSDGGEEVALIKALADLSPDSRRVVEDSLNDYYLVPHITKIISAGEKYGTLRWCVETDRGIKNFDIRNRNHDIKVFSDGRVRVRDSDDNRYVIDNYNDLDPQSKSKLIADI